MLEKLGYDGERIFDAELSEEKRLLVLTEACDMYFESKLTKEQVIELANDLLRIADTMANVEVSGGAEALAKTAAGSPSAVPQGSASQRNGER